MRTGPCASPVSSVNVAHRTPEPLTSTDEPGAHHIMTTTFLLIRHALHELGGDIIAGRKPGVHLNDAGRAQADGLCARLADVKLDAIYSSPMERTLQTAQPLAS